MGWVWILTRPLGLCCPLSLCTVSASSTAVPSIRIHSCNRTLHSLPHRHNNEQTNRGTAIQRQHRRILVQSVSHRTAHTNHSAQAASVGGDDNKQRKRKFRVELYPWASVSLCVCVLSAV